MADAIGPANISHTSDQRIIRVFSASLSGDRGRTAAAAEGPWSYPPFAAFQGLSQNASLSRTSQTDPALALYSGPSIANFDDRDSGQATEYPALRQLVSR
jgi:hypothetical protein